MFKTRHDGDYPPRQRRQQLGSLRPPRSAPQSARRKPAKQISLPHSAQAVVPVPAAVAPSPQAAFSSQTQLVVARRRS